MLPAALTEFGAELSRAIAQELDGTGPHRPLPRRRPPRRRRLLASVVVASALVVIVGVLLATGHGSGNTGYDEQVLRAADIALPQPAANTILYVSVTQTMTPGARGSSSLLAPTVNAQGWFQQGGPRRSVTREQEPGRAPVWQTGSRVYEPAIKHEYVSPPLPSSHPRLTLTRKAGLDSYALQIKTADYGLVRETVTSAQAHALRDRTDAIQWFAGTSASGKFFIGASVVSDARPTISQAGPPSSTSLDFPAELHRLLQSAHAHVGRRLAIDGRQAIQIKITGVSGYHRLIYDVDASTYRPVELDSYGVTSKDLTRIVFHAYQQLPLKGHAGLLHLNTAHGTTLDPNPGAYYRHIPALLFW